ncbi:hypothetical protein F5887DRAFT_973744 [Amanita rubescens]|nr:hypothetical protein F5887DRAFT_973744 [Amanita rubescens]
MHLRSSLVYETSPLRHMPTVEAQGTGISQAESAGSGDILFAIHNLPLEVLSKIFLLVLPTDSEHHERSHTTPSDRGIRLINPFLLCSICSMWRTLALATPQLWRRVFVYIAPITNTIARSKADDLSQWIQRSGSLPLTLYLNHAYRKPTLLDKTGPITPIIDVLTRYATRWEAFYLQSPVSIERNSRPLSAYRLGGWTSLRRVSLQQLYGITKDIDIRLILPWAQLTHLAIDGPFFHLAVDALRECRELTWLSIRGFFDTTRLRRPPLILPNLVTLYPSTFDLDAGMNSIYLPSLREMFISQLIPDQDDVGPLLGFLTRSACALDKLEIQAYIFREGSLVHVLAHQCCNSLISLSIHGQSHSQPLIEDEFLERLSLYHDKPLCPRLRFLVLSDRCRPGYASFSAAFLEMVKSRTELRAGDSQFHFLSLKMKYFTHEQELEEIINGCGMGYTVCREPKNSITEYKVWLEGQSLEMYFSDSMVSDCSNYLSCL